MSKILLVKGSELSILWTDNPQGFIKPEWWIYTDFPDKKGIYVWEDGVGIRTPTNKEWFSIFKNENPFLSSETKKVALDEWLKDRAA